MTTTDNAIVLTCTPPAGSFGDPPWRIADRANLAWTTCKVILEHVLLALGYVQVRYVDRGYRWSRTALGDQIAEGRNGR